VKLQFISNKFIITAQQYLIISIPFLLITGPFLSDLAVIITSILFLNYVFKNKEFKYFKSIFFKLFIIFNLYIVLSSLLSEHVLFSLKTSLTYLRFGLFSLSVWLVLDHKPSTIKYLFFSLLLIYSFLVLDGLKQFFTKENIFGVYLASGHRVTSLFGDEAILGSYLSRLLPMFFACLIFLNKDNNNKNYFYYFSFLFILIDILVFISAERASLFIVNFTAILLMILLINYKKFRFLTLVISILIFSIISIYYPASKIRLIDQTLDQIGIDKNKVEKFLSSDKIYKDHTGLTYDDEKKFIISKNHHEIYHTSFKIFKDNIYFGIGPKNFRKFCDDINYKVGSGCSTHPHNTYLQILTETGIIGFIYLTSIFITLSYYFMFHFYKMYLKKKPFFNNFQIALLVCIFISIWPLMPSGNFFNNWLSIIYFYPVGFFMWTLNKKVYKQGAVYE
jgi:hypothetical protein